MQNTIISIDIREQNYRLLISERNNDSKNIYTEMPTNMKPKHHKLHKIATTEMYIM